MSERDIHLSFETKSGIDSKVIIVIKIWIYKTVKEAEYKSCQMLDIPHTTQNDMIFIYNSKKLCPDLKISETGLEDSSTILVIEKHNIIGAQKKYLF